MHQLNPPRNTTDLFTGALARDPAGPLLTYYDDATAERTEVSATTLDNWVAKTANLVTDGLGLYEDASIAVVLPPHWQTAGILLGCWATGHRVVSYADVESDPRPDAVFCTEDDLVAYADVRADVVGVALGPFARSLSGSWPRVTDYAQEIGGYGDQFRAMIPVDPDSAALTVGNLELSHAGLTAAAIELAGRLGMAAGGRLMISRDLAVAAGPLSWLLAPLAAGCSIVLVTDGESDRLAARAESEKVTATLGIDLPGVPVLGGAPA